MTTNQLPTDLDSLRAIYAKMTPGEWLAHGPYEINKAFAIAAQVNSPEPETGYDGTEPIHCMGNYWNGDESVATWGVFGANDAIGIASLHNALPSLLDEVAALRREVERLRQRLRESDALMEMWTCPICDCTIRKVHMELCDGTPAPCPECGRIAAEEMVRLMRNALKLCIAIHTEVVWTTVGDADVDGYIEQAKAKGR